MKMLLADISVKVGKEDIFKPTVVNESLHEISNNNGVRAENFATLKNLTVISTMFPHCNAYEFTLTSPDGKTIRLSCLLKLILFYIPHAYTSFPKLALTLSYTALVSHWFAWRTRQERAASQ
jgi:hypothetical protein